MAKGGRIVKCYHALRLNERVPTAKKTAEKYRIASNSHAVFFCPAQDPAQICAPIGPVVSSRQKAPHIAISGRFFQRPSFGRRRTVMT